MVNLHYLIFFSHGVHEDVVVWDWLLLHYLRAIATKKRAICLGFLDLTSSKCSGYCIFWLWFLSLLVY